MDSFGFSKLAHKVKTLLATRRPEREAFCAERPDGRHVLEPLICRVGGAKAPCLGSLDAEEIRALHNEGAQPASAYPLSCEDGTYFTEALGTLNDDVADYEKLVRRSIEVLQQYAGNPPSLAAVEASGLRIQALDAAFAAKRIGAPLDSIHRCMGPDPSHPYSKITLCRTTFAVTIGGKVCPFFYEKFLVGYSYLDASGMRKSTRTPIHSHPLNFETVYFAQSGPSSVVKEQELILRTDRGEPVVRANGTLDGPFLDRMRMDSQLRPSVTEGPTSVIRPSLTPIQLKAFDSELVLRHNSELIAATDGLFRPHQVTVVDDPNEETRYFAIDNYFGPIGRVLLYSNDGRVDIWSHDDWDR